MNAAPRKDMSDERDEPLASEDEVEHEDDSVDIDMWKTRLIEWEKQEVIRKAEEERRLQELERQRREWEERRRQQEEEQRRLYEEFLKRQKEEEEELRRRMEEEQGSDLGDEEENWDEDNLDEDGNPIEEHYDQNMMDDSLMYNEYGEPVEMVTGVTVPGMFSDAVQYKTSLDILGVATQSTKGDAMAADWDDWGDMETSNVVQEDVTDAPSVHTSMVAHTVTSFCSPIIMSSVSHMVTSSTLPAEPSVDDEVKEEELILTSVAHTVSQKTTSSQIDVSSINHHLDMVNNVPVEPVCEEQIMQVDGMNDESSDEDMEQDDDEHKVPEISPEVSDENVQDDDEDSIMSVEEVNNAAQADNNQNDDKSDSDTDLEDNVRDDKDTSDDDDEENNRPGVNEVATAGESANYDSHEDSYASDFDEEVNERREERDSDDSRSSSDSEAQDRDEADNDNDQDNDSTDAAPAVQSDSDIEELEEIVEQTTKAPAVNDDENDDLEDEDEDMDDRNSYADQQSDSEFEEEDISNDVPVKQPCILVFDSLGGSKARQARLCAVLRDFLSLEYQEKYPGQKREFSTRTIPGCAPKVPQQPNLTDCGIYVCHNVETFFKKPIQDYTLPITSLKNWFPDSEPRVKRRDVATLIRKLATEQNQDKLEQLIFPDMVFVEPEKLKPAAAPAQRSDGESEAEDDYISEEEDEYYSDDREDRSHKRTRSDRSDISSDDDRSPRRRRHNDDSEDDFDGAAIYGNKEDHPTPLRKLPPGISISRSNDSATAAQSGGYSQSPRQDYPTPLRKLPPGISISRSAATPAPAPAPHVSPPPPARARYQEPVSSPVLTEVTHHTPVMSRVRPGHRHFTLTSSSSAEADKGEVTMEDISDYSDDNEIFDLDDPAHTRTYLSPNSYQALQDCRRFLPVGEDLNTSFSSMLSHQAAQHVIDTCLSSMVAHHVFGSAFDDTGDDNETATLDTRDDIAQVDGMDDFDSEEEMQAEPAESVPVNEIIAEPAAEVSIENVGQDINQPVEVEGSHVVVQEEFSLPETTEQHQNQSSVDLMEAAVVAGEIFSENVPQEFPSVVTYEELGNVPTEVSVDHEQMEQMVPTEMEENTNEDLAEAGDNSIDNVPEVHEADLASVEADYSNAATEEQIAQDKDVVDNYEEQAENVAMEDFVQSEELQEDEEEYVSDFDDEVSRDRSEYNEDSSRSQFQPPPVKKARMSDEDDEAEVVLDSDDEDDEVSPPSAQQQALPSAARGEIFLEFNTVSVCTIILLPNITVHECWFI